MTVSIERLRELLELREDGTLIWRKSNTSKVPAGTPAGTSSEDNYVKVQVDKKMLRAHRIVFAMVYGRWPIGHIDHIDGNRRNNRPSNLREVSHAANQRNRPAARNNRSGFPGVGYSKKQRKWCAKIQVNRKTIHLGSYQEMREAAEAYVLGSLELHGEMSPF